MTRLGIQSSPATRAAVVSLDRYFFSRWWHGVHLFLLSQWYVIHGLFSGIWGFGVVVVLVKVGFGVSSRFLSLLGRSGRNRWS